jgi:hypothetical protein
VTGLVPWDRTVGPARPDAHRLRDDPRTRTYAERRTKQGKTTKEIMRLLKRYLARELLPLLKADLQQATAAG